MRASLNIRNSINAQDLKPSISKFKFTKKRIQTAYKTQDKVHLSSNFKTIQHEELNVDRILNENYLITDLSNHGTGFQNKKLKLSFSKERRLDNISKDPLTKAFDELRISKLLTKN